MKRITLIFTFLGILVTFACAAESTNSTPWGPVTKDIQMSIGLKNDTDTFSTNKPIVLIFRYRNVGTNDMVTLFNLNAPSRDATYSITIVSPSGNDVSPQFPSYLKGSSDVYELAPQQIKAFDINMRQFCKFDEMGVYNIQVKKILFKNNRKLTVTSNPLKLIVSN